MAHATARAKGHDSAVAVPTMEEVHGAVVAARAAAKDLARREKKLVQRARELLRTVSSSRFDDPVPYPCRFCGLRKLQLLIFVKQARTAKDDPHPPSSI